MRAIDIITDAYERLNRLSPGEALNADDAAFGFRRLNLIVDEMSAKQLFLYKDVLTSAVQTGHITLAAGSWASIPVGTDIISATSDNKPLSPITMQQFNELYAPTQTGIPNAWAHDGLATVYLWPVATGQTIKLQTRVGVVEFVDQTTTYSAPAGYKSALGAQLAVALAPTVLGEVPAELIRAERKSMYAICHYEPAIIDVNSYMHPNFTGSRILNGP